jgi:uncharacterized protein YwbE
MVMQILTALAVHPHGKRVENTPWTQISPH